MGGTCSSSYDHVYALEPTVKSWEKLFSALKLSENDVGRLFRIFKKMDKNEKGCISIIDMLNFLDCDRTKFTTRVFSMFDADSSGKIDFREFVVTLWNYCTISKENLG